MQNQDSLALKAMLLLLWGVLVPPKMSGLRSEIHILKR